MIYCPAPCNARTINLLTTDKGLKNLQLISQQISRNCLHLAGLASLLSFVFAENGERLEMSSRAFVVFSTYWNVSSYFQLKFWLQNKDIYRRSLYFAVRWWLGYEIIQIWYRKGLAWSCWEDKHEVCELIIPSLLIRWNSFLCQEVALGLLCPVVPKSLQPDMIFILKLQWKGAYLCEGGRWCVGSAAHNAPRLVSTVSSTQCTTAGLGVAGKRNMKFVR